MTASLILVVLRLAPVHRDPRAPAGAATARAQERRPATARSSSRRARLAARRGDHHRIGRRRRHDGRVDQAGRPHAPRSDRRARHRRGACRTDAAPAGAAAARVGRHRRCPRVRHDRGRGHGTGPRVSHRAALAAAVGRLRAARAFGGDAGATGIAGATPGLGQAAITADVARALRSARAARSPSTRTGSGRRCSSTVSCPAAASPGSGSAPSRRRTTCSSRRDVRRDPSGPRRGRTADVADRRLQSRRRRERSALTDDVSEQIAAAARERGPRPSDLRGEEDDPRRRPRRSGRGSRRCSPRWGASACSPACCCS